MKRRILILILLTICALAICCGISACSFLFPNNNNGNGGNSNTNNDDEHEHLFEVWRVSKYPTCTEEGLEESTCSYSFCYEKSTRKLDPTGHYYEEEWTVDEDSHWHKAMCIHQDMLFETGEHDFKDGFICPVCNYEAAHTEGLQYAINADGKGYSVQGLSANDESITVPKIYLGLPVTEIGANAFAGKNITEISLPDTIKLINSDAFSECTALATVTYRGTLGEWCGIEFETAKSNPLNCGGALIVPKSNIASNHRWTITVPNTVTKLNPYAFYGCSNIQDLNISSSVETIGREAFAYCTALSIINIKYDIEKFEYGLFRGCENLAGIGVYKSPKIIEDYAFYGCEGLQSLIKLNECESIGAYAFYGCSNSRLTSITIPQSVQSIGENALTGCNSLTSLTIPFLGASADGNQADASFSYLFGGGAGNVPSSLKTVSVTGGTAMAMSAFSNCANLVSVTIRTIPTISTSAFALCTSLTDVTLGDGVTNIGWQAFYGCSSLKNVTLGAGLKEIGVQAFQNCTSLRTIRFPASVHRIRENAFEGCRALALAYFNNTEGWKIFSSAWDEGESIDVTKADNNADNLRYRYYDKKWEREVS